MNGDYEWWMVIKILKFYLLNFFKHKQIQIQDLSMRHVTSIDDIFCFQCPEAVIGGVL